MLTFVLQHVVAAVVLIATSLSLNFDAQIDTAFMIVNRTWPLFVIPVFLIALRLIGWIIIDRKRSG